MNISLENKTAVICGSTQGIGLAIAQELAALNCRCMLIARDENRLQQALDLLKGGREGHGYAVADFTSNTEVEQAITRIVQQQTVHILINNTGGPAPGAITEAGTSQFSGAFSQHLLNYQLLAQAVFPGMKQAGYGRIINIVSTSVKIPIANLGVSNTIRAATAAWAKTWSLEAGPFGITVNNILPGYTSTQRLDSLIATNAARQQITAAELAQRMQQQIPARRFGKPAEIAALAAFLASPAAAYINGASIPVDGGSTGAF